MDELMTRRRPTVARLSLAALRSLPSAVSRPSYERRGLKAGIVHIGVGNFHRAHMAAYLDDLFEQGLAHDWAIVGAGVTPFDAAMRDKLKDQDWLTTVIEQDADGARARVTGAMIDFIDPADKGALVERMTDPAIRIVSLTVTEGGYFINPATGGFDVDNPAIMRDAAKPDRPETVFGLMLAALARRRVLGVPPFTVLSCDNVPHNGNVARRTLAGLARLSDPSLAEWVERSVAFPNGMVDRITPATGDQERALAASAFGVADAWPVFCEPFRQWVVEDDFPLGRPPLEKAGVTLVPDVTPWETMKIRILNGGHAVIAYPAGLLGIGFVHDAMSHPLIRAFLDKVERDEIIPHVPPVPGTRLNDYYASVAARFGNPSVGDTVRRLCFDGSNRQPKFIVPSVADALQAGLSVKGLALCSALWQRYCLGRTDAGEPIAQNDPNWDRLTATAERAESDPLAWLAMGDVYGAVGDNHHFRDAFAAAQGDLRRAGTEKTLSAFVRS
jgi:mannitol 2-dehydrogenase